jgi:hypothetical protein
VSPTPLTDADRVQAWRVAVPDWFLRELDTSLGTASVVPLLKAQSQCYGSVSNTPEDGPYPEWSRWIERCPKGMHVRVYHGEDELLREGFVVWNELANRSTVAACELRHATREPQPGEQVPLFA